MTERKDQPRISDEARKVAEKVRADDPEKSMERLAQIARIVLRDEATG